MNIQNNNYNLNFGAKRILNVRKAVKNGNDEVIDVFQLTANDKKFLDRIRYTIANTDRKLSKNGRNVWNAEGTAYNQFRDFFQPSSKKDSTVDLIAVKNGEIISGVAELNENFFPEFAVTRLIFPQKGKDNLAEDSLIYAMLAKIKEAMKEDRETGIKDFSIDSPSKQDGRFMDASEITKALRKLNIRNKEAEFQKVKEQHEYDLEDFLGIKDLETEIM